jgi:hypothetical protein
LIGRLADPKLEPGEFLFKPSLVQRESVAGPPAIPKKGMV